MSISKYPYTATIQLSPIKTLQSFIGAIGNAVTLPAYFGGGMDALNDCMRDLSWIDNDPIILQFIQAKKIKDDKLRQAILDSIDTWQTFWGNQPHQKMVIIELM